MPVQTPRQRLREGFLANGFDGLDTRAASHL